MKFSALFLVVFFAMVSIWAAAVNEARCKDAGEMRRRYNCAAITHHRGNACCYKRDDGVVGTIPTACCGTGWVSHDCEGIIDDVCDTHHDEL